MKFVKIGIIVASLGAAVAITWLYGDDQPRLPDTDASNTLWKCTACEREFALTAHQAGLAQAQAHGVPIECVHCRKVKAYQLMACLKCNTRFFGSEVPGESGQCPKCNPDAEPWLPETRQAPEEEENDFSYEQRPGRKRVRPKSL